MFIYMYMNSSRLFKLWIVDMDNMDDLFLYDRLDFVEQFNGMQENDDEHSLFDLDTCCYKRATNQTNIHPYEMQHNKYLFGEQINEINGTGWLEKPIEDWYQEDTTNWLVSAASYLGQPHGSIQHCLAIPGKELICLTRQDFMFLDPTYGDRLYDLLHSQFTPNLHAQYTPNYPIYEPIFEKEMTPTGASNISDAESENSVELSTNRPLDKPRVTKTKKNAPNQGKLWEFIRDLLRNRKTCPSLICWEDYSQAKFRFVRSDEVAKLWGSRKGNTKMTYEKLSRAMRYYYKRKIFLPVLGRRLVYQFGPNATGWQTDNPNFRH